jgi:hypothetical protein
MRTRVCACMYVCVYRPIIEVNLSVEQFPQSCVLLCVMTVGKVVINCDSNFMILVTLHEMEYFDLFHEALPSAL